MLEFTKKSFLRNISAILFIALSSHVNFAQDIAIEPPDPAADDLRAIGQPAKRVSLAKHNFPDLMQPAKRAGLALNTGGKGLVSPINYHGGPLMGSPVIYLIFYGDWNQKNGSDTPAGKQIILDWAKGIGTSPRYALADSFDYGGYNVSGNAVFGGAADYTGSIQPRLSDSQILAVVDSTITGGGLPWNPNGVYFVVTSSNVTASSGFCSQYCSWHSTSKRAYGQLKYSFVGNPKRCLNACAPQAISPNNNPGVDAAISFLTHELEEIHTNPEGNAWHDPTGAESADKCAWTFGHFQYQVGNGSWANLRIGSRDYMIQRGLWHTLAGDFCMVDSTHN